MATNIDLPQRAVETVNLEDAVIFSPQRFVPPCLIEPAHHGKGSRPPNSPSLRDAILWVNHVTVEDDRRLMRYFPERTGYILFWNRDECQPKLAPLERVDPEIVPDALEASKSDLDWSNAPDPSTFDPYADRF